VSAVLFDLGVVAHVGAAVVGYGALGATAVHGDRAARSARPREVVSLRRYFRPGRNWAARAVLLVPVLGGLLLGLGDRGAIARPWPWIGLGAWTVTAALASAVVWPAERKLQAYFALPEPVSADATAAARRAGRRASLAGGAIALCFLVAVVVMVGQP
jgi:hypothetical protein